MAGARWVRHTDYYQVYSEVLQSTKLAGAVKGSLLSATEEQVVYQGVAAGHFARDVHLTCPNRQCACTHTVALPTTATVSDIEQAVTGCPHWATPRTWDTSEIPLGKRYGPPLHGDDQVLAVEYSTTTYPGVIAEHFPSRLAGLPVEFVDAIAPERAAREATPTAAGDLPVLVSPFFEFDGEATYLTETAPAVCLAWDAVPDVVKDPQRITGDLQAALENLPVQPALPAGADT
jgi:hypothetical protein